MTKQQVAILLSFWQLTPSGKSISIGRNQFERMLDGAIPGMTTGEILRTINANGLIVLDNHGDYILSSEGISVYKAFAKEGLIVKRIAPKPPAQDEWKRFRKLLGYYIDCISHQERKSEILWNDDYQIHYFFPDFSATQNWLHSLEQGKEEMEIKIPIQRKEKGAGLYLGSMIGTDAETYIGYPLKAIKFKSGKCGYSPICLIPVTITEHAVDNMILRVDLGSAEINQTWLEYDIPRESRSAYVSSLYKTHRNDEFEGCLDVFRALPLIEAKYQAHENLDHCKLQQWRYDFDNLEKEPKSSLLNTAALFAAEELRFGKKLKSELRYIRDKVQDEVLDRTALAYVFREHPLEIKPSEETIKPLPFIQMNSEQQLAVEEALNYPVSRVTGPPGTGKSQVAVNIIANMVYRGKSVLFSSMNHKAVHAIEDRAHDIFKRPGALELIHFCQNEDGSSQNPWYKQDLDTLVIQADETLHNTSTNNVSIVERSAQQLKQLEEMYAERDNVIPLLAKSHQDCENLNEELRIWSPFEDSRDFSSQECSVLSGILHHLVPEPSSRNFLKHFFWIIFIRKKQKISIARIKEQFPGFYDSNIVNIRKHIEDYLNLIDKMKQTMHAIHELENIAKRQPSVEQNMDRFSNCKKKLNDNLSKALEYQMANTIHSLENDPDTMKELKDSMLMLNNAHSTSPFLGIKNETLNKAENAFSQFVRFFPGWAVSLLSMYKASPCLPGFFDKVIIDEASQCIIPPMIPALFRAKTVTVIGDPNQFPPVIDMKEMRHGYIAKKHEINQMGDMAFDFTHGTAYSVVNRIPIMLCEHFRCSEEIANFFNNIYYQGRLQIMTNEERLAPRPAGCRHALEWIDVRTHNEEIEQVYNHVKRLLDNQYHGSIGVVTVRRDDASELGKRLESLTAKLPEDKILINTANGFQGGERDVVFFMLGYHAGLPHGAKWYFEDASNRYIYNVAASRAKACLIIIGNREYCLTSTVPALQKLANMTIENEKPSPISRPQFDSIWEKRLYDELLKAGIETIPQYRLVGRRLDLAAISGDIKLDIEVDGAKYHTNSAGRRKCDDFWRDEQVMGCGWQVKRFMVYDLEKDMDLCVNTVKNILKTPCSPEQEAS